LVLLDIEIDFERLLHIGQANRRISHHFERVRRLRRLIGRHFIRCLGAARRARTGGELQIGVVGRGIARTTLQVVQLHRESRQLQLAVNLDVVGQQAGADKSLLAVDGDDKLAAVDILNRIEALALLDGQIRAHEQHVGLGGRRRGRRSAGDGRQQPDDQERREEAVKCHADNRAGWR